MYLRVALRRRLAYDRGIDLRVALRRRLVYNKGIDFRLQSLSDLMLLDVEIHI